MSIEILPLGAGQDVGRSCVVVRALGRCVLFDCGIHMGYKDDRRFPAFNLLCRAAGSPGGGDLLTSSIDAVVITHFHLDHIGALPLLTEVLGYRGPVIMTVPTKAIAPLMLSDYHKVLSQRPIDDPIISHPTIANHNKTFPLMYSKDDISNSINRCETIGLGETLYLSGGCIQLTAHYAGHVLGAVMYSLRIFGDNGKQVAVLYTGDFNSTPERHLSAADPICSASSPPLLLPITPPEESMGDDGGGVEDMGEEDMGKEIGDEMGSEMGSEMGRKIGVSDRNRWVEVEGRKRRREGAREEGKDDQELRRGGGGGGGGEKQITARRQREGAEKAEKGNIDSESMTNICTCDDDIEEGELVFPSKPRAEATERVDVDEITRGGTFSDTKVLTDHNDAKDNSNLVVTNNPILASSTKSKWNEMNLEPPPPLSPPPPPLSPPPSNAAFEGPLKPPHKLLPVYTPSKKRLATRFGTSGSILAAKSSTSSNVLSTSTIK